MAALTSPNPTLLDLAKMKNPDGTIADVVEMLTETNEVLDDMTFEEGNHNDGHLTTVRSGLPQATWRKLYGGVKPSKGKTVQVKEGTGMLEAYSEVDEALVDLSGNAAEFRFKQEAGYVEGMSQEMSNTLFYGDVTTEPEKFTGFAPRFNSKSADNGDNIIDAGGTGADNASIWLVVWSPRTCFGIVPKGSEAGLARKDLGVETTKDSAGGLFRVYRTHYKWQAGLCVSDWRYVVRIANIDKSDLSVIFNNGTFSTGAHLPNLMFKASSLIPNIGTGRAVFYMSRDLLATVSQQTSAATQGSTLTTENVGGKLAMSYLGMPIKRCDALAGNEARVV